MGGRRGKGEKRRKIGKGKKGRGSGWEAEEKGRRRGEEEEKGDRKGEERKKKWVGDGREEKEDKEGGVSGRGRWRKDREEW